METITTAPSTKSTEEAAFDKAFKPRGAMFFFALLIVLGSIIWYGIYFLMLQRA